MAKLPSLDLLPSTGQLMRGLVVALIAVAIINNVAFLRNLVRQRTP